VSQLRLPVTIYPRREHNYITGTWTSAYRLRVPDDDTAAWTLDIASRRGTSQTALKSVYTFRKKKTLIYFHCGL